MLRLTGGIRFWSPGLGGVKSGSAALSWGAWSMSVNIAEPQLLPL